MFIAYVSTEIPTP